MASANAGLPARGVDCYFDFVSPWSYLALERLDELPGDIELRLHPVLFAALLQHWGHLGPAEIAPKRLFTLRHAQWIAERRGLPFTVPPMFPFNPVALLRLAIVAAATRTAVQTIFRFVWQQGRLPDSPEALSELQAAVGVCASPGIDDPAVKKRLRENGERAIARGVFGVPTFIVDDELFWGNDGMDFLLAYLDNPRALHAPSMQRLKKIPGIQRRRT